MTNQKLILAVLLTSLVAGCAPSLATSSAQSPDRTAGSTGAPPGVSDHCRRLSNTEDALRYVSVGAAVLGGGSGLATLPVDDRQAETGLAITAAGFAVVAGASEALRAEAAANYIRDCE